MDRDTDEDLDLVPQNCYLISTRTSLTICKPSEGVTYAYFTKIGTIKIICSKISRSGLESIKNAAKSLSIVVFRWESG